jgi:ATP-binding cassette subfamily B (MDR/TAP) protein 6
MSVIDTEQICKLMLRKPSITEKKDPDDLIVENGEIHFDNVSFFMMNDAKP